MAVCVAQRLGAVKAQAFRSGESPFQKVVPTAPPARARFRALGSRPQPSRNDATPGVAGAAHACTVTKAGVAPSFSGAFAQDPRGSLEGPPETTGWRSHGLTGALVQTKERELGLGAGLEVGKPVTRPAEAPGPSGDQAGPEAGTQARGAARGPTTPGPAVPARGHGSVLGSLPARATLPPGLAGDAGPLCLGRGWGAGTAGRASGGGGQTLGFGFRKPPESAARFFFLVFFFS